MKSMLRPLTYGTLIALVLAFLVASAQGPSAAEQDYIRLLAEWDSRLSKLSDVVDKADSKETKEAANKGLRAERQNYANTHRNPMAGGRSEFPLFHRTDDQFSHFGRNQSQGVDVLGQTARVHCKLEFDRGVFVAGGCASRRNE